MADMPDLTPEELATHAVGDRWQHDTWPAGTPDAVVGEITASGWVGWAERGGSTRPSALLRFMTPGAGWRKVGTAKNGVRCE